MIALFEAVHDVRADEIESGTLSVQALFFRANSFSFTTQHDLSSKEDAAVRTENKWTDDS